MSEPVQLAKAAREQLAAALNALQTADVPDELVDAAEPVAQAMGVLHKIERTNGASLEGRQEALDAVRAALGRVQKVDSSHPAVERVMEAIADALSKVLALKRYEAPVPMGNPVAMGNPVGVPQTPPIAMATAPVAPPPAAATPQPVFAPPPAAAAPQPVFAPPPVFGVGPGGTLPIPDDAPVAPAPVAAPPYARPTPPVLAAQYAQPEPPPQPRAQNPIASTMASAQPQPQGSARAPDKSSSGRVDVELGTHSTSNFYKGLSGNDVIEHGGIFVATYKVLKRDTLVTLRVLLPGDYEFTATAVVQWTREGGSSEPGYGARFTQISQEGRQLVYRYTRNREPMFYDDL